MGGSIFFFLESKSFEFSVEEGGSFFLLRIFERYKDSLRSVFMGKESAFRLLTYIEDHLSNTRPDNFARTFRDGNKVLILQMGFNAHGSFLMISELLHGRRKGLIIVPEGKLGSGWRGFGFHLRKAIAPVSPGVKLPPLSAPLPSLQKSRKHKSFLAAAVEGDRKSFGGSRTGKLALPNIQNSIKSTLAPTSRLSSQKSQSLDLRDRGAGQVSTVPEDEVTLELQDDALSMADSPLSLEVSLHLVRGLNGKWDIKSSNIKEVGCSGVGPLKDVFKPNALAEAPPLNPPHVPKLKPKTSLVWQPRRTACKELLTTMSCPSRETHSPDWLSPGARSFQSSPCPSTLPLRSSVVSDVAAAHSLITDKSVEARFESPATTDSNLVSDVAESELLGSDESEEARNGSACSTVHDESLVLDPRLFLQEHSGNFDKKWGNSEQWVLELRDGRRVAVPVQIALPPCEATEVLEKQQQLVTLEFSEVTNMSLALFEEDDVLVEDWASDSFSEEANQPLVVDPIAFSLPLAKEKQSLVDGDSVVGVDTSRSQEPYSDWFQKRFNNFDSFLGTSLVGLEDQATEFLLAVEAELYRRAEVNKKSCGSKGSGVKGLRELKGLFSSINYGSSSSRRCGINRNRVLSVAQ